MSLTATITRSLPARPVVPSEEPRPAGCGSDIIRP